MQNLNEDEIHRLRNFFQDLLGRYKDYILMNYEPDRDNGCPDGRNGGVRGDEGREFNLYTQQEKYEEEGVEFFKDMINEKLEE